MTWPDYRESFHQIDGIGLQLWKASQTSIKVPVSLMTA
jgi:hypothetical protein